MRKILSHYFFKKFFSFIFSIFSFLDFNNRHLVLFDLIWQVPKALFIVFNLLFSLYSSYWTISNDLFSSFHTLSSIISIWLLIEWLFNFKYCIFQFSFFHLVLFIFLFLCWDFLSFNSFWAYFILLHLY